MNAYPRHRLFILLAVGILGGAATFVNSGRAENPQADVGTPLTQEQAARVKELREQYPFESLAERLRYEEPARKGPAPALKRESELRLNEADAVAEQPYSNHRTKSLETLHSENVAEFIRRDGMGVSRVMDLRPSPRYLPAPDVEPIPFAKLSPLSSEETAHPGTSLLNGERAASLAADRVLLSLLPARGEVNDFHAASVQTFANPFSFGYAKGVDRVAGFVSHRFVPWPPLYPPVDAAQERRLAQTANSSLPAPHEEKRWHLTRLELVSLLKHETPRVYIAEHLPNMDELKTVPTRGLVEFESNALAKLHEGEELLTSSTPNRIEMLGAIRASKQCMQCHEVPRGTLLGAFSYELRRDPPIKIAPKAPVVQ